MLFALAPALACAPPSGEYTLLALPDPLPENGVIYGWGAVTEPRWPVLIIDGLRMPLTGYASDPPFATLGADALLPTGSGSLQLSEDPADVRPVQVVAGIDMTSPAPPDVTTSRFSTGVELRFESDPDVALWEVEITDDADGSVPIVRYADEPKLEAFYGADDSCEPRLYLPGERYTVRVRGWDGARNVSPWSESKRVRGAGATGCTTSTGPSGLGFAGLASWALRRR